MNKYNDENIKKIIKTNVEQPDIKLSSREVLARFKAQKHIAPKARSLFSFPSFKIGLSFVATALVIGTFVYLSKDIIVPPITSTSTSEDASSFVDREFSKLPGGKEGEFVFMSFSATSFTADGSRKIAPPTYMRQDGNNEHTSLASQAEIEDVLNQTLPLVDDFYAIDNDFAYEKYEGVFIGVFDTYTTKYIIDVNTYILCNVDLEIDEDETETELEGEIHVFEDTYRYSGQTEIDLKDNESDISLKIEYSATSYLEIQSENEGKKQQFTYTLVENNEESFVLEIETFRHGDKNVRYVETNVEIVGVEYKFIIGLENETYIINYARLTFTVTKDEDGNYIYSY